MGNSSMKQMFQTLLFSGLCLGVMAEQEIVGGYTWSYRIVNGEAEISDGRSKYSAGCAISPSPSGTLIIPMFLGGYPITRIGDRAFQYCSQLRDVVIPCSVREIGYESFTGCGLKQVVLPYGMRGMDEGAFVGCTSLENIILPPSLTNVSDRAFAECIKLKTPALPQGLEWIGKNAFSCCWAFKDVVIPDSVSFVDERAFNNCTSLLSVVVSTGLSRVGGNPWYGCSSLRGIDFRCAPPQRADYYIRFDNRNLRVRCDEKYYEQWQDALRSSWIGSLTGYLPGRCACCDSGETATLTLTNVVVNYVRNSVSPDKTIPAAWDTGFVNIITEVKSGGAVSVPATWAFNYPDFVSRFGANFTQALMKPTGKRDGSGNPMLVWQDYVAGTDPTNPDDKFVASITITDNTPIVSWTPELSPEETALRKYTIYGKVKLTDHEWIEVPAGHEADSLASHRRKTAQG